MSVSTALQTIQRQLRECEQRANRPANSVRLLAVSKGQSVTKIREALLAGQVDFGENYVQDAVEKIRLLADTSAVWHYIGRIQSNKTAIIAECFDWVHSLCSRTHARRLSAARANQSAPLNVCVQVNIDDDPDRLGIRLDQVSDFVQEVAALPGLTLRGLMAMPRLAGSQALAEQRFGCLTEAGLALEGEGVHCDTLSMGTSQDYPAAIAAGATWVRIGTEVFGARK